MNLSKYEMRLIAKMRGIKVKKSISKTELFRILKRKDKIIYNESPLSIITDIRSNLSKRGHKLIENGLKYAEEMKDLTYSQVKSFKEKLIKFNNDLIKKNKIKKDFDDYYEKHKIKAVKDVKYLSDDFVYEDIRCLFHETNDIESNEILSNEIKSYEAKPYEIEYYELNLIKLNLMRLIILILTP